jgi:hypothetical protein
MRSRAALVVLVAAILVACAGVRLGGSGPPPSEPEPSISIRIGPDGPELSEDAVAALQAYGAAHADEFGGLYVDDQARASFVLLFTGHLDEHAAALAEIWPRVTVKAVPFTEAALTRALESLDLSAMKGDGVEPISAGLDTMNNRVTLELKSDDPTLELRLERQYEGMVDVTVYPIPGPWANVTDGPGWRLLATGQTSGNEAYLVHAATNDAELQALWRTLALDAELPEVDLADEVVVSFAHGIGSSCPEVRLDGVEVDGEPVFSRTSDPLAPRACTQDLVGAVAFVVALDRTALPPDGFTLRLGPEPGPPGEPLDVALP